MKKLILIVAFLLPLSVMAQIPKPMPNTYVNDFAGILTPSEILSLNQTIRAIEDSTSVQVAIVLVDKLPSDMSIEEFSLQIGRQWHVGNAENGLVYVAAISDHKQRLEVAGHLEGDFTDIKSGEILDNIKPFFRSKDYNGGLHYLLQDIRETLRPATPEQLKLAAAERAKKSDNTGLWLFWIFFSVAGIGIWLYIARRNKRKKAFKASTLKTASYNSFQNPRPYPYNTKKDTGTNTDGSFAAGYATRSFLDDTPSSRSSSSDYGSSSSSSSSPDYGSWGSGSSDSSSSSDSGFSGGGSSSDW